MVSRRIKAAFQTFATCIVLSLLLLPAQCFADEHEIEIAPHVINLQCGGNDFSVHTTIPCGDVDGTECLRIEGAQECTSGDDCCEICSDSAKCDNSENFVGKFEVEDVARELCLIEGSYRLVISGTINGASFTAGQECEMECDNEGGTNECDLECEKLQVIDNPFSCSSNDKRANPFSNNKTY